jgi:hypothetical protein
MIEKLDKVMEELRRPFHPSHVTWRPGKIGGSSDKAQALAYADLRAYQNRLDEVCGANWSVSYTPWGERLVCNLTIFGVTRSSTGEPDSESERFDIAGTVAEAQAFKRACAMFGLGRYLYNLPSVWAEYDPQRKQFTEQGKAKLSGILTMHYQRSMEADAANGDGEAPEPAEESRVSGDTDLDTLRRQVDELGQDLYGDQWEQVRQRNVQRVSGGKTTDSSELDAEQLQKLVNGMMKLKSKREVA